MGLFDGLRTLFALEPLQPPRTLSTAEDTMAALIASRRSTVVNPWRAPSVDEALGVPAILRAVSLIANTIGRLNAEAYRDGALMPQGDAPQIIKRPNPLTTPRVFYRDSAYYLATRGECWWWVPVRDGDGNALSLVVVPPWEITVVPNASDRFRPTINWLGKPIRREDMRQITFLPDDEDPYRGKGPLQLAKAAVSVSVEAQTWAANYFAGGISATNIYTDVELTEAEATDMKAQYVESPNNLPRIIPPTIRDIKDDSPDPAKAQLTDTRAYSNGDAARMFGIPGALLEYAQSGTSLTYQNVESVWRQFQEGCLTPNYLEPIEQEMSDLLTRSTVARLSLRGLLRADPLTRAQIYNLLIPLGVMTAEQAAKEEGYLPGDVEYAPVPFSSPAAAPPSVTVGPVRFGSRELRCDGTTTKHRNGTVQIERCNKLLSRDGMFVGQCPGCKKVYPAA